MLSLQAWIPVLDHLYDFNVSGNTILAPFLCFPFTIGRILALRSSFSFSAKRMKKHDSPYPCLNIFYFGNVDT